MAFSLLKQDTGETPSVAFLFAAGAPAPVIEKRKDCIPSDLRAFLMSEDIDDMKTTLIDGSRRWLTTQPLPNLHTHIRSVREEFTGLPEINFYHAALIIKIRREIDLIESLYAFRSLWNQEKLFLIKSLGSRWLVSAVDTLADHGTVVERGGALAISTFINLLKMAETEYKLCGEPAYDSARLEDNITNYPVLWDETRVFRLPEDDCYANMIYRIRHQISTAPILRLIFETLLSKIALQESILSRMAQHHIRNLS